MRKKHLFILLQSYIMKALQGGVLRMNIKAIMCDIDGTILNDKGVVCESTLQAIRRVREKNILFGLCTGRDVHSVRNLLTTWKLDGLVDVIVGTGGAEICDFTNHIETNAYPLDGHFIKQIISHYEDMDVNFAVPCAGVIYAPKDDEHIRMLSTFDQIPYKVVDFDAFLSKPRAKVMIVTDPDNMENVIERSKTFADEHYKSSALKTASVLFEYMDPRISKSDGLKKVMDAHQFQMEELCCFGDADNDYDMILHCGVGVVMGNGSEKTKSVANYITDDNNHDGIANFINQYII